MRYRLQRAVCRCLIVLQILGVTAVPTYAKPAWPSDTGIQAEAGIVIDADSGAVLFGQNIHNTYYPASITKLLTALIVLEHCSLDETVEYTSHALLSVEADSGNKLSLREGDTLTVEDSLYALLLISVNQCANGLAEHTAGSMSAFVDLMNEKVAELGLTESHFDNPSGLNGDTQYVSAYDMAMIARAAFANEDLLRISSSISHKIGPTQLFPDGQSFRNEHRLIYTTDTTSPYYCPEAVAGKTGYLIAAGNTLVTYGERDGRHVISVILKGQPRQYFIDGKELLLFGLDRFQNINIAENETRYASGFGKATLSDAWNAYPDLYVDADSVMTLPNSASFEDAEVTVREELGEDAPLGAVAQLVYTYNDRQVGSAWLMTDGTVVQVGAHEAGSGSAGGEDGPGGGDFPQLPLVRVLTILMVIAILVIVVGGTSWLIVSWRNESRDLEERKARRRERLTQGGKDQQEEFERILQERRKRK
ncbi:MAG: D-alanyl-D-alanine carboxypeptidase [Clostridiales bacterium]|nr:D-alanyl-D-alanine carboxypeptidase [Clostridiales bacterium]